MKKLKVGLLGMGRIGRLHGDNITYFVKNAEIVAAADPMLNSTMEEWAAELGIPKVYSDPMKVVQDPEVEAVFICTSTPAHAELSIAAAKAGKHIFCEKPVHTDLSEIRKILAEVEKAGVKFQVGFVRRFDHNHKAVRDTVASGKLGAPSVVKVTSRDPADQPMEYIATSGGIHIDMTIHDQLASVTKGLVNVEGVSFTRFVRKDVIQVYGEGSEFEIGKGVVLHESAGDKATIITSGIMVDESLKAYEALQAEGISVRVIDMFTWKPLDEELVLKAAKETGAIVTAENHNTCCGLGSVVANCLAKNCPTVQEFVGVQDEFGQVGPQSFLMDTYGLRAANIVEAVKKAIARK